MVRIKMCHEQRSGGANWRGGLWSSREPAAFPSEQKRGKW